MHSVLSHMNMQSQVESCLEGGGGGLNRQKYLKPTHSNKSEQQVVDKSGRLPD
jgi:hypothetical protein